MSQFDPARLKEFTDRFEDQLEPDRPGAKGWATFSKGLAGVNPSIISPEAGRETFTRSEVFRLGSTANDEDMLLAKCAAILSWGGMSMAKDNDKKGLHQRFFEQANNGWLAIAKKIQHGCLDRESAYDEFRKLRAEKNMHGVGPAYFTKLIYFLMPQANSPKPGGYIMDQWAGRSVNYLLGRRVVHMNYSMSWNRDSGKPSSTFTVSDLNTGADYERFCAAVDALLEEVRTPPGIEEHPKANWIDAALVGKGKPNPSRWRSFLLENPLA